MAELIRGIHPQVLADYRLEAAIPDVADRSAVPVGIDVDLPGRMPEAVEATAYFVVCEALTNVARHSGATRASVTGRYADGRHTVGVPAEGPAAASWRSCLTPPGGRLRPRPGGCGGAGLGDPADGLVRMYRRS